MTRVAALLRVSTVRQARKHREDEETLPVQRENVRRFVAAHGDWELTREYAEEGVSAWSNSSEQRDILQEVLADAKAGRFDVLVLFKYERLSRQSFEYPMLLYQLRRMGIRTWTVADDANGRELTVDSQTDKVLRFFEGWSAETESYNTSVRVSAKMRHMAEQGLWTGGRPPYGFRLRYGHGSNELPLELDPEESAMVRTLFSLYHDDGLGSNRVADRLNGMGYRQRNGRPWSDGTVRQVLSNPMMMGRPAYGRTYSDPITHRHRRRRPGDANVILAPEAIPEWVIVSSEVWEGAQRRMSRYNRTRDAGAGDLSVRHSRSEASGHLLSGLMVCGHCGGSITGGYSMPTHKCKDGRISRYRYGRYVCRDKQGGRPCKGQGSYGAKKVDGTVVEAVRAMLAKMSTNRVFDLVRERALQDRWQKQSRLDLAAKREERAAKLYEAWTGRLNSFLAGHESLYTEKYLAERVREAEADLETARVQLADATEHAVAGSSKEQYLESFFKAGPNLWERFEMAEVYERKRILRCLIERMVLSGEGIVIHWKLDLDELTGSEDAGDIEWRERLRWVASH